MTTLRQQAEAIVATPKGAACVKLSGLPSWQAVLQFAQDSRLITPELGAQLNTTHWQEDFSAFVAPADTLVTDAEALRRIPPGAFVAFIEVDPASPAQRARSQPPMGKRHLIHAMLHLGDGWAAGSDNYRALGIGKGQGWEVLNLADKLRWVKCTDGFGALDGVPLGVKKSRLLRIRCRPIKTELSAFIQRYQASEAAITRAVAENDARGDARRDKFDVVADLLTTPGEPLELLAIADWNSVKTSYANASTAFSMLLMQAYRKRLVDQKIQQHATACERGQRIVSKSVGSTDMTSDYDITVGITGGDVSGAELDAIQQFNDDIRLSFGQQPGTVFDTNVYAKDFLALNADDQRLPLPANGAAMYQMMVEGQDIGALIKQRRYMSKDQWDAFQDHVEAGVEALNPAAKALAVYRYESADHSYLLKLAELLAEFQRRADPKASATYGTAYAQAQADVDKAVTEQCLSRGERLILKQAARPDYVLSQFLLRYKVLCWEHSHPDLVLWANNDLYVAQMREIRADQQQGVLQRQPAAAAVRVSDQISSAIFFASEAYLSEGALRHVVDGVQAANAKPGMKPDEKTAAIRGALMGLTADQLLQSMNEQFGDFLKDFAHYGDAPEFLFRGAKYLQRLFEALGVLAQKRQAADAPGQGALQHLSLDLINSRLGWNCSDILARLNAQADGLVAVRKGKAFASSSSRDDYCRNEVKKYFGADSGTSLVQRITAMVMLVNEQVRSGSSAAPSDEDVRAYFRALRS